MILPKNNIDEHVNEHTTPPLLPYQSQNPPPQSSLSSGCQGVFEHEDNRVSPEEHLRDEAVLVDRL